MKLFRNATLAFAAFVSVNLTQINFTNVDPLNNQTYISFGTQPASANWGIYLDSAGKIYRLAKAKKVSISTVERELGWCGDYVAMGQAYAKKKGWSYFNTVGSKMYFE